MLQQHPPCLVGLDASPFGFVPPLCGVVSRTEPFRVSVWCGQPDRAFPCLCGVVNRTEPFRVSVWCGQPDRAFPCVSVVWSAGQSLSVSLCGVASRTEPFRVCVWYGQLAVCWSEVCKVGSCQWIPTRWSVDTCLRYSWLEVVKSLFPPAGKTSIDVLSVKYVELNRIEL